jgi:hypothetical protein
MVDYVQDLGFLTWELGILYFSFVEKHELLAIGNKLDAT